MRDIFFVCLADKDDHADKDVDVDDDEENDEVLRHDDCISVFNQFWQSSEAYYQFSSSIAHCSDWHP
jgi:hypothetical protein